MPCSPRQDGTPHSATNQHLAKSRRQNTDLPDLLLSPEIRAFVTQLVHLAVCSNEILRDTITLNVHGRETLVQVAVALRHFVQVP
jgi:hypothetical protein